MLPKLGQKVSMLMFLGLLSACGDQGLFMSLRTDISDLQITTVNDGQIVTGQSVPLTLTAQDSSKLKDLEMEVTLTSGSGASVWHNRQAVPALNEQLNIQPPSLPPGQYRMDVVVYSSGEVTQKKTSNFFVAKDGWRIAGIKSYPPVITSSGKVLLKADLQYPDGADPWLRWSWKGKVIQKGALSQGLGKILWTVPADEGVYTITLEMFPVAPTEADYSFSSSVALSTDVYVSTGARPGKGDLGPDSSYFSLMHMQASLDDVGAGARKAGKTVATAIGSPEIVSTEEGFGYRLAPGSGFSLPWFALPVEAGSLRPFTVTFGISFDSFNGQNKVFTVETSDASFTFTVSVDSATRMPQAVITSAGSSPATIPWSGPGLLTGQRYLLSLSIIPQGGSITGLWYLNGFLVVSHTVPFTAVSIGQGGASLIGGDNGFAGVIDELGVYFQDSQGRPSTDPSQYQRVAQASYGQSLVLAEGFEGTHAPAGFTVAGKGVISTGGASLPPDSALSLPPTTTGTGAVSFAIDVTSDSPHSAVLRLQWQGDQGSALEAPVALDSGELKFRVSSDGKTVALQGPTGEKSLAISASSHGSSTLTVSLVNPAAGRGTITVLRVLAHADKD